MNMSVVFFGFTDEDFRKALRHAKAGIFIYSAKWETGMLHLALFRRGLIQKGSGIIDVLKRSHGNQGRKKRGS